MSGCLAGKPFLAKEILPNKSATFCSIMIARNAKNADFFAILVKVERRKLNVGQGCSFLMERIGSKWNFFICQCNCPHTSIAFLVNFACQPKIK